MTGLPEGTVTFLLTDVEGSTRRWDSDPEAMKSAVAALDDLVDREVSSRGGHVVKARGEGDSHFCVFARASDAVAAAGEVARRAALPVRVAVNTGEAELRAGDYFGPAINRAARLRAIAHGGQVLLAEATARLSRGSLPERSTLADCGLHRLRDLAEPEHVHELRWGGAPEHPPLSSLDYLPTNLPEQRTSFVGREDEIVAIRDLLRESRLVTLTGSAGCGKTRLALHVAADVVDDFESGCWLVDLAPLGDPTLIPVAIAAALGILSRIPGGRGGEEPAADMASRVLDHLKPQSLLLVLDNCEHLVDAAARITDDVMTTCHAVRVLATSREPLGVAGEATFRVPNLDLPDDAAVSPESFEAGRLFCDRARLADAQFRLTSDTEAAVTRICRQLDGIPLAIELAAARVRAFGAAPLADRLDDMFRVLKGGGRTLLARQQTLEAAIDWSYALLTPAEQLVLRRLSVFVGGFTLEAAEAVCSLDDLSKNDATDAVTALVDKSLVDREDREDRVRYRTLESIRQYARAKVTAAGEGESLRDSHLRWCVDFARRFGKGIRESGEDRWFTALDDELDNLRVALEWALAREDDAGAAAIIAEPGDFWYFSDRTGEAQGWAIELLRRPLPPAAEGELLGMLVGFWLDLNGAAFPGWVARLSDLATEAPDEWWAVAAEVGNAGLAYLARDGVAYDQACRAAFERSDRLGMRFSAALALLCLVPPGGPLPGQHGDRMTQLDEALTRARAIGSGRLEILVQTWRSAEARRAGNVELSVAAVMEALPVARALKDAGSLVHTLNALAYATLSTDTDSALAFVDEAIARARRMSSRLTLGNVLHSKGEILVLSGRGSQGAQWLDEAESIAEAAADNSLILGCRTTRALGLRLVGELSDAVSHERSILGWQQEIGALAGYARGYRRLAQLASACQGHERAAPLFGAFDRKAGVVAGALPPFEFETYTADRAATVEALGEERFEDLRARGAAMSEDEAVAFALDEGGA